MEDRNASVPEEVVFEVMPLSCNFPDYKDTFTPSKPFPSREAAISWLQLIGGENKFVLVTKRSDAGALSEGKGENCCDSPGHIGDRLESWEGESDNNFKEIKE
ncbi:hypothetical protein Syun_003923 [Stephania yunnanensis]|uniref:Uncharacterized protein n=1 Tax=Stephania yunnanensis TaxID=152371 RepID=A0AAP0L2C9_9MAGN